MVVYMANVIYEDELKNKFDVFGYQMGNTVLELDDDFDNIRIFMNNRLNEISNEDKLRCINTKRTLIRDASCFFDNLFDLHDVRCISNKLIKIIENNETLWIPDEKLILKSPYSIPIRFASESKVREKVLNNVIYFYMICLERRFSKELLPIYVHEIAHTQLDSQKGSVENYHNNEIIPIFLEKLVALVTDETGKTYRNICIERYEEILKCIKIINNKEYDSLYRLDASVFLNSILKADYLFEMYMNVSTIKKSEILLGIQMIFDGKETVEDFLCRYNICLENSKKNFMKRKIRIK